MRFGCECLRAIHTQTYSGTGLPNHSSQVILPAGDHPEGARHDAAPGIHSTQRPLPIPVVDIPPSFAAQTWTTDELQAAHNRHVTVRLLAHHRVCVSPGRPISSLEGDSSGRRPPKDEPQRRDHNAEPTSHRMRGRSPQPDLEVPCRNIRLSPSGPSSPVGETCRWRVWRVTPSSMQRSLTLVPGLPIEARASQRLAEVIL